MNKTLEKIEFVFAESDFDCDLKHHSFMIIENKPIKEAIKKQHKGITSALWMCEFCAKVKQSN